MAMLPLIFIGVVLGLLVFGKSLDFFAMLGLLGLIGMNIRMRSCWWTRSVYN
mgnify:CR=1 FL=1